MVVPQLPPARPRFLTPRECCRLQGFPESFVLPDERPQGWAYTLLGNAVSAPLIAALGGAIFCCIDHGGAPEAAPTLPQRCRLAGIGAALRMMLAALPAEKRAAVRQRELAVAGWQGAGAVAAAQAAVAQRCSVGLLADYLQAGDVVAPSTLGNNG